LARVEAVNKLGGKGRRHLEFKCDRTSRDSASRWGSRSSLRPSSASAQIQLSQAVEIAKTDSVIDAVDPPIKLFLREKMAAGESNFTDDNSAEIS
jgi:hypothetical protein